YVLAVLDAQFRASSANSFTTRLEDLFARTFESKYAIAFTNGTATMHAALAAAGIGPGDEVIVPPLTMASTAFAVLHAGATPVFADIDPDSWTLSPASVEQRITARTRAILPVAIYGLAPDMDGLMAIAGRNRLFVLEDDAQCFLGRYKGRMVGSIGDASSFSFQNSKHMTSGEGGMITTNDERLATGIRRFNSLGYAGVGAAPGKGKISRDTIQDPLYQRHASVGYNYRMPELCAAVALAQLERLPELVAQREMCSRIFMEAVARCEWLRPQRIPAGVAHSWWSFVLKLERNDITWYDFRDRFRAAGGDGIYGAWQLTYLEPAFLGNRFGDGQAQIFDRGLCPVAESVQPYLLQFKTNYTDIERAETQARILRQTIASF
ncbi:MAG: DegT/DnrJ/EryC1/StrS family aminotransferase, partial [Bryobacteraceae bacterium]